MANHDLMVGGLSSRVNSEQPPPRVREPYSVLRWPYFYICNERKWTRPSPSPAMIVPSSDIAQHHTSASQVKVVRMSPVPTSHTLTVLSHDADIAVRPFGVTATPSTTSEWPFRTRISSPLSRFQTLHVLSDEVETARSPPVLAATPLTQPD
jgi:hypothetical protein